MRSFWQFCKMHTQRFTRVCINYLALQHVIAAEPQADNQKIYLLLVTHYTTQQQSFYGPLSGTTRVSRYHKKHSPTHHSNHYPIFISFFHLPRSIASSLFKLRAWQSFCTTSLHVLFDIPLGLEPSTSYSIHFFTQSVSSFCSTCPYHRNLFCCSINIISPIPSLSLVTYYFIQYKRLLHKVA